MAKKNNTIIWIIVILLAIALLYFFVLSPQSQIPLSQEAAPATLSNTNSSGTGIAVTFYNCPQSVIAQYNSTGLVPLSVEQTQCTQISVPASFSSAGASIVTRQTPITCTTNANCYTSYNTNLASSPYLECYNSQCVLGSNQQTPALGSITTVQLSIGVTNPGTSQITFTGVSPTTVTPAVWSTAMGTMTPQTLAPGATYTWPGASGILTSSLQGTNTTFSTTISGTNSYTGQVTTATSTVTLQFLTDPTGGLTASISSPI